MAVNRPSPSRARTNSSCAVRTAARHADTKTSVRTTCTTADCTRVWAPFVSGPDSIPSGPGRALSIASFTPALSRICVAMAEATASCTTGSVATAVLVASQVSELSSCERVWAAETPSTALTPARNSSTMPITVRPVSSVLGGAA